ncbi:MAG: discoidin domain-containing protein [Myxococcota bacterium]
MPKPVLGLVGMLALVGGCSEEPAEPIAPVPPAPDAPPAEETRPAEEAPPTPSPAVPAPSPAAEPAEAEPTEAPEAAPAASPFADQRGWIELQRVVEVQASASSHYRGDATQLEKLFDGDYATAWNSATMAEGATAPETLTLTLPEGVKVHAIGLTAGYTKTTPTRDLFTANRRIEEVVVRHGDRTWEATLLTDDREIQDVEVEGGGGEWVIELRSWVDGERPDWREMVVSELRVLGELGEAPATTNLPPDASALRDRASEVIRRYHRDLGPDAMAPERRALGEAPREVFTVGLHDFPSVPITLPDGGCWAVVVDLARRVNGEDEPGLGLGEGSAPEVWDLYAKGQAGGTAVFGLEPVLCARSGDLRRELAVADSDGIQATVAIFAQTVDPEALEDDDAGLLPLGEEPPPPPTLAAREGLRLTALRLTADVFGREPGEPQQVYMKGVEERAHC